MMKRLEILTPEGNIINTILAHPDDVATLYPGMGWRIADQPPAPESPPTRRVTVLAFRRRFTAAERAAIEWAAVDRADQPDAQRQQAAALRASLADQAAAKFIDLDDADVAIGVQTLEALTLIVPGRADEILGAEVQDAERP